MTVREVVLHRDIRTSFDFSAATLLNRHHLRRFLSVFALAGCDVVSIVLAGLLAVRLTRALKPGYDSPPPLLLISVCLVVVTVFLANGLYGRRFMRHSRPPAGARVAHRDRHPGRGGATEGARPRPPHGGAHDRAGGGPDLRRASRLRRGPGPRLRRRRPTPRRAGRSARLVPEGHDAHARPGAVSRLPRVRRGHRPRHAARLAARHRTRGPGPGRPPRGGRRRASSRSS